jgi:hypothetical protein
MKLKLSNTTKEWLLRHQIPWIYGYKKKLAEQIDKAIELGKKLAEIEAGLEIWEAANPELYKLLPWYESREQFKNDKKAGLVSEPALSELLCLIQLDYQHIFFKTNANNILNGEKPSRTNYKTPKRLAVSIKRRTEIRRKQRALQKIGAVVEKVE